MKRRLEEYIVELLFDHECIIIPEFGAFLSRQQNTQLNVATNMLRPPHKNIAFNARLHQNDGVLANYIAKSDKISYRAAMLHIGDVCKIWSKHLKRKEKVSLENIGRLFLDSESNIQFSPAINLNFDLSSYGLPIFRAEELSRVISIQDGISKAIETHKTVKAEVKIKARKNRVWLKSAAVMLPLIGLSALFIISNPKALDTSNVANLNPLEWISEKPTEKNISSVPANNSTESIEVKEEVSTTPIKVLEISEPKASEIETPIAKTVIASKAYHLVVGSFKEKSNALNYLEQLNKKGQEAYICAGDSNFFRVSVGSFESRERATQELKEIKTTINSGAWVYSK